jgi:nucleoside-diphosphate-sugar epimerase
MKRKKVLITGGEGFLGTYLVDYFSKKDQEVVVFDKLAGHVQGDITLPSDVRRVFEKFGPFETVYHLASAMPDKVISDDLTRKTNVEGTSNVVREAVKRGVKSFMFTSTNVTYGIPKELPVTEETPLRPLEVYGRSKAQAEAELAKFRGRINIGIFRCPVITGVGRLGLQAILFEFISENRNIYVLGDGLNRYQFVDAMDVCIALEKASHVRGFDIYNIGGDGIMPLREIYQNVIEAAGSTSRIVSLPKAPALMVLTILDKLNISPLGVYQYSMLGRSLYMDTTKIKIKLRWKPKKTNAESFIENYQWYIKNKETFTEVGSGSASNNRSLPKMKIFTLLKLLS